MKVLSFSTLYIRLFYFSIAILCLWPDFPPFLSEGVLALSLLLLYSDIKCRKNNKHESDSRIYITLVYFMPWPLYFALLVLLSQGPEPSDLTTEELHLFSGAIQDLKIGMPASRGNTDGYAKIWLSKNSPEFFLYGKYLYNIYKRGFYKRLKRGEHVRIWCFPDSYFSRCKILQLEYQGRLVFTVEDVRRAAQKSRAKNRFWAYYLPMLIGTMWMTAMLYSYWQECRQQAKNLELRQRCEPDEQSPAAVRQKTDLRIKIISAGFILLLLIEIGLFSRTEHFPRQVLHVSGAYIIAATIIFALVLLRLLFILSIRKKIPLVPVLIGSTAFIGFSAYITVLIINAVMPPQTPLVYEGRITDRWHRDKVGFEVFRDIFKRYYISLDRNDEYGFPLHLPVSKENHHRLRLGMHYRHEMTRGGLGIAYRFRR
jgi:hypothetical protein